MNNAFLLPGERKWSTPSESPEVTEGHIHITVKNDDDKLASLLTNTDKIVLENDALKPGLELKGQAAYGQAPNHDQFEGIYLNKGDLAKYIAGNNIVVRRYKKSDTVGKMLKAKGVVLAFTAAATLLTGLAGVGNTYWTTPSGIASTQSPQSIVKTWTEEPKILLQAPNLTTDQVTQVNQLVQTRQVIGTQCLQARDGHAPAPHESVPGVDCTKPKPYKTTHFWGWVTAVLALITGAFGVVALIQKFGFQQKP